MLCCLHKSLYNKCPKNHVFAKQKKQQLMKKRLQPKWFPVNITKHLRKAFFIEYLFGAASWPTTES